MIGTKIKMLRVKKRISQVGLAEVVGVSQPTIVAWENNKHYPGYEEIVKMCRLFEVNVDYMLDFDLQEFPVWRGYAELEPDQQQVIVMLVQTFLKLNEEKKAAKENAKARA